MKICRWILPRSLDETLKGGGIPQTLGKHTIVSTNCSIDHDCHLGDFVSVCPRAALCGGVRAGNGSFFGAGCTIRNYVRIAANCTVGMGAALVSSIEVEGQTWVGVPARPMRLNKDRRLCCHNGFKPR